MERFIQAGPPTYSPFVLGRFRLTRTGGARRRPPCAYDITMAYSRKPTKITLNYYTGRTIISFDTETTVAQVWSELLKVCPLADKVPDAGLYVYGTSEPKVSQHISCDDLGFLIAYMTTSAHQHVHDGRANC